MIPALCVRSRAVLSAASTASNPELQKMVFPVALGLRFVAFDPAHRSKVIWLKRRGELRLERVGMHISHGVEQPAHLRPAGLDHTRAGMAGRGHSEGGGQIEVFLPFGIPNMKRREPSPTRSARSHPAQ